MFISHQHRFVFLHIPKTGGTSVQNTYLRFLFPGQADPARRLARKSFRLGRHKHHLISEAIPEDYFVFSFVRNPWDRLASYYLFRTQEPSRSANVEAEEKSKSFKQWLLELESSENAAVNYQVAIQNQVDVLGDRPDFIGRFENLQQDFYHVCRQVGLPPLTLLYNNRTTVKTLPYSAYYDSETKAIVAEKYRKDIEAFGYQFEDAPPALEEPGLLAAPVQPR